jgi:mannose-6-phosphate isomerase-like protein (cupin superfamily)
MVVKSRKRVLREAPDRRFCALQALSLAKRPAKTMRMNGPRKLTMNRTAIYARFSTDLQNERPIDDQLALCRAYAEKKCDLCGVTASPSMGTVPWARRYVQIRRLLLASATAYVVRVLRRNDMSNSQMTEPNTTLPADDLGRTATIVHPDDPGLTHLGVGAGTYTILISGEQTGGRYTMIDMLVPAGGPPPHRHDFEEIFHILEGELQITFRDEVHHVGPGQSINIPANAPHGFRVVSATPARFLCICLPAGQEEFFKLVGEVLPTRNTRPTPPTPEVMAERRGIMLANAVRFHSEFLPTRG